jgi:hypothetical protein
MRTHLYTLVNQEGHAIQQMEFSSLPDVAALDLPAGHTLVEGVVAAAPAPPEDAKKAQWMDIKQQRYARETSWFTWNGKVFDSTPEAVMRIHSACIAALVSLDPRLTAQNAPAYSEQWTLKDNSVLEMSATDILAMGAALAAHISACHAWARARRAEIFAPS